MEKGATLELKDRKPFYSPGDVARMAGVSSTTVLDWIHSDKLFAVRLSPRIYRIPLASVIKLLYPSQLGKPTIITGSRARSVIAAELRKHAREHQRRRARGAVRSAS